MLLLLVRHGLTDLTATRLIGRLPGIDLNARGHEQAAEAATRGLDVTQVPGLNEVDYGVWAGQEYKVLQKTELWKLVQRHPSRARFPGGESVPEAQARVVTAIEELASRHPKDIIAAYSHSDMIKLAVAHYVGMALDMYQRTNVGPGSITALHIGAGGAMLVRLGATASLDDLKPPPPRKRKN